MNKSIVFSFSIGISIGIGISFCYWNNKSIKSYIRSLFINRKITKSVLTRKTSLSSIPEIPEIENENEENLSEVLKSKIMKTLLTSCDNISLSIAGKTLDSVLITLRISRILLEDELLLTSKPLIEKFYQMLNELERKWLLIGKDGFKNIQVIVIEGLGSSGKSLLVSGFINNNVKLINISPDIISLKAEICNSKNVNSEILLKAIDIISLYQLAIQTIESNENVVIIERYYHSYCVQNICDNIMTDSEIDSLDSVSLLWPLDLPKPTLVIFLSLSTEMRLKRRKVSGGTSHTVRSIERSIQRDTKALKIYGMIKYNDIIAVDASGTPDEVLNNSLALCQEYNVNIKYPKISKEEDRRISLGVYGALEKTKGFSGF